MKQKKLKHFRVNKSFFNLVHQQSENEHRSLTDIILNSFDNSYIVEFELNEKDYRTTIDQINLVNEKMEIILEKLKHIDEHFLKEALTLKEGEDYFDCKYNEEMIDDMEYISNQILSIRDSIILNGKLKHQIYNQKLTPIKNILNQRRKEKK